MLPKFRAFYAGSYMDVYSINFQSQLVEMCDRGKMDEGPQTYHFMPKEGAPILERFTGLLDKNGKEIYEGDIITGVWRYQNVPFFVSWDLYGFRLRCVKKCDHIDVDQWVDCPTHIDLCEVIGNIRENSELLNQS